METQTIQLIKASEKAKFLIEFKAKAESDLVLYWHYQTVKDEIVSFMFNNTKLEVKKWIGDFYHAKRKKF